MAGNTLNVKNGDPYAFGPASGTKVDPSTGVPVIYNKQQAAGSAQSGATAPSLQSAVANVYGVPGYDTLSKTLQDQYGAIGAQKAPLATAAQLSPFSGAAGAQVAPAATAMGASSVPNVSLSPAAQAGGVSIGAGQAGAVNIGPAAQAQDSAFRANQSALANQLQQYVTGQTSVSRNLLQNANQQNLAQQLALAASSGSPLAQRAAAQNMGAIGAGLANQQAIAGIQEQEAAASQLNNLLGTARGQDQSTSQFNAGQQNQQSQAQGQISSNIGIANAQNKTQAGIAQGNLNGQLGMFNAGQQNNQALQQAQMNLQNGQFNAGQQNQLGMFNAGQQNQQSALAAQLGQQNSQFNAGQQNQYNQFGAQLGQQNSQFNAQQQLAQQQAQNTARYQNLLAQLQLSGMQQQGSEFGGNLANQLAMNQNNNQTQWNVADLNHIGPGSMLLGGAAAALPWAAQQLFSGGGGGGGGGGYMKMLGSGAGSLIGGPLGGWLGGLAGGALNDVGDFLGSLF